MSCPFPLDLYSSQKHIWPSSGRHILAHYDDTRIVVYQAYKSSIGHQAALHQDFLTSNPEFRPDRMTWVKPNFLWMMYRSGWGTKSNQQVTLAISLSRQWFEDILSRAVLLSESQAQSSQKCDRHVIVQWDPDHDPMGENEIRRAIQIGIRNEVAQEFAMGIRGSAILAIDDVSEFVHQTRMEIFEEGKGKAGFRSKIRENIQDNLKIPVENVYPVGKEIFDRLRMEK